MTKHLGESGDSSSNINPEEIAVAKPSPKKPNGWKWHPRPRQERIDRAAIVQYIRSKRDKE